MDSPSFRCLSFLFLFSTKALRNDYSFSVLFSVLLFSSFAHSSNSSDPITSNISSFSPFSLKLAQKSLREIFHHQMFGEHNAFESTRYGLRIDHCPNGGEPEVSEQDGRIKLCQLDAECKASFKCENIVGLTHFGKQIRFCCPTKISVCTLKPKLATDISSFPVGCHRPPLRTFYFFDVDRMKCAKGRMAQCEGFGANQFATELECRTKCETTACELGESILLHNDSFDSPFLCSLDDDCPVGYNCRQDNIFRRSVCCGFLNFEPCPLGFRSFVVPFTGRTKPCKDSDTKDECPADFVCTQNALSKAHFCCTVEKGVCPQGHQAYIHPLTDGTIKCNLRNFDVTTSCPPGYVCLEAVFGSIWGFCCAQAMTGAFIGKFSQFECAIRFLASCPEGSYPQINLITKQPQRCELTRQPNVCTSEFECETNEATHLGFCCSIHRHEKVKPTAEPTPRKRTKTTPSQMTTNTSRTIETTPTANTMEIMEIGTTNSMEEDTKGEQSSTTEIGVERRRKGEGWQRKRGKWRERKSRKKGRQRENGRKVGKKDRPPTSSSSFSSSSSEQSEKADLIELSTKLDRFINGIRKRAKLPKGHKRTRPNKWKGNKSHTKWGRKENSGRIFGKRDEEDASGGGSKRDGRRKERRMEERGKEGEEEGQEEGEKKEDEEEPINTTGREEEGKEETMPVKHKKRRGSSSKIPKCPHGFKPMNYPGTRWTFLECVMDEEWKLRKRRRKTRKRKHNGAIRRRREKRRREWREEEEKEQLEGEEEAIEHHQQSDRSGGDAEEEEEETETDETDKKETETAEDVEDFEIRSTVCPSWWFNMSKCARRPFREGVVLCEEEKTVEGVQN